MSALAVTVTFRLAPGARESFLPLIEENARCSVAGEPGCLRFDVAIPEGEDGTEVFLYEVYANRAAFAEHLETPHYASFDAATRPVVIGKEVKTFSVSINE